jgi:hypothetical protein
MYWIATPRVVAPLDKDLGEQLGTVVDAHRRRAAVHRNQFVEDTRHAGGRNRRAHLDRQGCTRFEFSIRT